MTSYVYNPTAKVKELLSKYLDFDPSQLDLGIWSGDISLKNVNLKQETVDPMLNKSTNRAQPDPTKQAPLGVSLVSGTVGHMRLRIPWKRLVWGQGAVQVEISDVRIVVTLQSREESEVQRQKAREKAKRKKPQKKNQKEEDGEPIVSKSYREAKQRRLKEAERRHLQGLPVAMWLDSVHRKNSIERDAAKADEQSRKKKVSKTDSRLDRWMSNTMNDFFWRFYAGLQGRIEKARIVIVQDGVEVGCIVHSIEIVAGKEQVKVTVDMGDQQSASENITEENAEANSPPPEQVYEGEYDDGEHVDKQIRQQGLGIFIRKEVSMAKVPKALRFSSSVSADDYILRPVNLDLSFSFFYPYSPERRKSINPNGRHGHGDPTATTASSTAASNNTSASSQKRRRGKREKAEAFESFSMHSEPPNTPISARIRRRSSNDSTVSSTNGQLSADPMQFQNRRRASSDMSAGMLRTELSARGQRRSSTRTQRSTTVRMDDMSAAFTEAPSMQPEKSNEPVPRLNCKLTFHEIRAIFSNRHYELCNHFLSTVARMQNGRPPVAIRSVRSKPMSSLMLPQRMPSRNAPTKNSISSRLTALLTPLTGYGRMSSDQNDDTESVQTATISQTMLSPRSQVVVKWWQYSIGAVIWELRRRRFITANFRQMYISFDWTAQQRKRREYIDLYIARRLEKRTSPDSLSALIDSEAQEDKMIAIEDHLPLEQILLYRSIAHAARIRGIKKMPATVGEIYAVHKKDRKRKKDDPYALSVVTGKPDKRPMHHVSTATSQPDNTLLHHLQNKFEGVEQLRSRTSGDLIGAGVGGGRHGHENTAGPSSAYNEYSTREHTGFFTSKRSSRKSSIGHDSAETFAAGGKGGTNDYDSLSHDLHEGSVRNAMFNVSRKGSVNNDGSSPDFKAGAFYSSAGKHKESVHDSRAHRTIQTKRHLKAHEGALSTASSQTMRESLRFSFSVQVRSIELMVIHEEYSFDITPDEMKNDYGLSGPMSVLKEGDEGESESSSSVLSDLSVLTDDQRFFNEEGQMDTVLEEATEDEGAKLTPDFFHFGQPENLLLQIAISPVSFSAQGRASGKKQMSLSVGRIVVVGEDDLHLLSIGSDIYSTPVSEIRMGPAFSRQTINARVFTPCPPNKRKPIFDESSQDESQPSDQKKISALFLSGYSWRKISKKAISLNFIAEDGKRFMQCDISKVTATVNLSPIAKLFQFHSRSDIRYPDKIIPKSSRDVARKFLVYKTEQSSSNPINTAIRFHSIEIEIPFGVNTTVSEASDMHSFENYSGNLTLRHRRHPEFDCMATLSVKTVELFSGSAVDELTAATATAEDIGNSFDDSRNVGTTTSDVIKPLKMLDIEDLTASQGDIYCRHWIFVVGEVDCILRSESNQVVHLFEAPASIEGLLTTNEQSILESASARKQVVIEVSPIHVLVSEDHFDLLNGTAAALDTRILDQPLQANARNPDPSRIEVLARHALHSIDVSCKRVRLSMVNNEQADSLSLRSKSLVMEECLSDFLSIVSCFDFSLPNEEALSSAMQICIGRLVGLGLTDDAAWGCTNAARLNFLDDIALMRRAQSDALMQMAGSIRKDSDYFRKPVLEEVSESESASNGSIDLIGSQATEQREDVNAKVEDDESVDDETDNDSANSVDIVETTLNNAVEKTIATFAPLLQEDSNETNKAMSFLTIDLPFGVRLSTVKLFYDSHTTFTIPSLLVTNAAGIELVTIVPSGSDAGSVAENQGLEQLVDNGIVFSRFDLDQDYGFGSGGLPMDILGSDEGADDDSFFRDRRRFDDIQLGEIELLFSSETYEKVFDEIGKLKGASSKSNAKDEPVKSISRKRSPRVEVSQLIVASCLSALMTSDELTPFCRLTLEDVSSKSSSEPGEPDGHQESGPSLTIVARSFALQNLTPEGQFYPDAITLLSPDMNSGVPFEVRYYESPDSWKHSSRLELDFRGYRVFLTRQFVYELLHYFTSERYGVGRLSYKYSQDMRDMHGNPKPPLLYTLNIFDSSVICPECSSSSDLVSFEVESASIAVSYNESSFAMPTSSKPFDPMPSAQNNEDGSQSSRSHDTGVYLNKESALSDSDDYFDCVGNISSDGSHSEDVEDDAPPVSAFMNEWKKRLTITLENVRAFTAQSSDPLAKQIIESPLFRFFHKIDGRAEENKAVYCQRQNLERHSSVDPESLIDVDKCSQVWEEISPNMLNLEILVDYDPHLRLLIADHEGRLPLSIDARQSQLFLLLNVWYSNMQELPTMFPFVPAEIEESSKPPTIPKDFPDYGSEEFVSLLEDLSSIKSEVCCIFKRLSFRCTFDPPGHFPMDPECLMYFKSVESSDLSQSGLILSLSDAVIHVVGDSLDIKRIGIGASSFLLTDERQEEIFQNTLSVQPTTTKSYHRANCPPSWADVSWGLRTDIRALSTALPLPFQVSVFMTPGWSLINVGVNRAESTMFELSWIWIFLEYFKSYFAEGAFGNPGFEAEKWIHKLKNSLRKSSGKHPLKFEPLPGVNVDFRLWLYQPVLRIPSDYRDPFLPCVHIESKTGLWYRYNSLQDYSSQKVASTGLDIFFANGFHSSKAHHRCEDHAPSLGLRSVVDGLSFSLQYDCNDASFHNDVSVAVPFSGRHLSPCSVVDDNLYVDPFVLPSPKVCNPHEKPGRSLGRKVCDVTFMAEVLPVASKTMTNFFCGPELSEELTDQSDSVPTTLSISAELSDMRLYALDPILGVQLPIAVLSISSISLMASQFLLEPNTSQTIPDRHPLRDFHLSLISHIWVDYFKLDVTRSWEPLVEPFKSIVLYEKSHERGQGLTINSDSAFHINLSSAFLKMVSESYASFVGLVRTLLGQKNDNSDQTDSLTLSTPKISVGAVVEEDFKHENGSQLSLLHEVPKPLKSDDQVAFSLLNLTGQKIRIHQQANIDQRPGAVLITYLEQAESMGLTFAATVSIIKNLNAVEVPYPGLPNSGGRKMRTAPLKHAIDVQIPGFRWVDGITVDTFGRRFEPLIPRSHEIDKKLANDWRLRNALMVLSEVGLDGGGRLLTIRSLFEIRNLTTHKVNIVLDPDPTSRPCSKYCGAEKNQKLERIEEDPQDDSHASSFRLPKNSDSDSTLLEPGGIMQIPTLLIERSLSLQGNHLGCIWLRPESNSGSVQLDSFRFSQRDDRPTGSADFCSRPIQLAKVVHESAQIFEGNGGEDVPQSDAVTSIQVSCPTDHKDVNGNVPFCYAIEVARSPIVSDGNMGLERRSPFDKSEESKLEISGNKKENEEEKIHGPISYTMSLHPPLIIANLLPEGGRFELMHAITKTVVWYSDLKPGEQVPVHSVGLDAPLRLFVNLGFCRTPVGEGALVHHGVDVTNSSKEHKFMSIGKAVTKSKKQIEKKLTAMADSPDKRVQAAMSRSNTNATHQKYGKKSSARKRTASRSVGSLGLDTGETDIFALDGKIHSVETATYSQSDVEETTEVVDGAGQRLTLNIENIRGGGGQRRVSLFCPFWFVNCTEHPLRYRQENSKQYVSGTVLGPNRDGARPVDGSNRNYRNRHKAHLQSSRRLISEVESVSPASPMNTKTIFSGTPGALATSPGRCDLSPSALSRLIAKDIPLTKLADLAFMFNFHGAHSLGNQAVSMRLHDGTDQLRYSSRWSRGISLDSVGFSQVVGIPFRDGKQLELSVVISVAPGFMSGYSKIVRILPRYVIYNKLDRPIRLWQDSSRFKNMGEESLKIAFDVDGMNKDTRKWQFESEDKIDPQKVNQYELLNGKSAVLPDTQDNGMPDGTTANRSSYHVAHVRASELLPFHLPDSRGERELRVDLGGSWNLTASFASDFPGEHTLKLTKAVDLRLLSHVPTRSSPKYKIVLPPPDVAGSQQWDGDLGVYFETDWGGDRRIIVKGTKRGKFAFNHTDIHVGDELLRIDGMSVFRMTFAETMKLLKERVAHVASLHRQQILSLESEPQSKRVLRRLSLKSKLTLKDSSKRESSNSNPHQPPTLSLTFRTLEERLRKLRLKSDPDKAAHSYPMDLLPDDQQQISTISNESDIGGVRVEMKSINDTMFVVLKSHDENRPPFRIQNRSINHIIFYRQRGCDGHPWNHISPGESHPYSWEEPMKSKKLTMRVALNTMKLPDDGEKDEVQHEVPVGELIEGAASEFDKRTARTAKLKQALAYQFVDAEEEGGFGPSVTVRLEEIGHRSFLPVPVKENQRNLMKRIGYLNCEVDTDGETRLLVISDDHSSEDERGILNRHLETLREQIIREQERTAKLCSLRYILHQPLEDESSVATASSQKRLLPSTKESIGAIKARECSIEINAKKIVEDYPEDSTIIKRHQILVEVIEAVGLNSSDLTGSCNPYCEVIMKGRSRSKKRLFQSRKDKRKTYYVERSSDPKWADQSFLFDVPEETIKATRGHSVRVKVRNFRLIGQHPILGQTSVHFGSLRNQQELEGWYPLAGRSGRQDIESAPLSDGGRGSIKLRTRWIYTVPALIDYFIILSERRTAQIIASRNGMKSQLAHALESDRRKREARERTNVGRHIKKISKFQQRRKNKVQYGPIAPLVESDKERTVVKKFNHGLNTSLSVLKDTLKISRDRYLYALYFQTIESKRTRLQGDGDALPTHTDVAGESNGPSILPSDRKFSSFTTGVASDKSKLGLDAFFSKQLKDRLDSPHQSSRSSGRGSFAKKSLDDFFARDKLHDGAVGAQLTDNLLANAGRSDISQLLNRRTKSFADDVNRHLVSHRKLSLDIDEAKLLDEQSLADWEPSLRQGQAVYDGLYSQAGDMGISDLISVSTDADEESKRRRAIEALRQKGFLFHSSGVYFHEDHLPRQFRRSIFSGSVEEKQANMLYRPKFAIGTGSSIRHFKSWQSSQAIYYDTDVDVIRNNTNFVIRLKDSFLSLPRSKPMVPMRKTTIATKLAVPSQSTRAMIEKSSLYVDRYSMARARFERTCSRNLRTALNPGGWLTVRPITVLNLPDSYTGMFVKLRYGSEVLYTETVDAKITPRWTPTDFLDSISGRSEHGISDSYVRNDGGENDFPYERIKNGENDLNVHVEPHQTSGSIKISVVAERLNTKTELGVLTIPLGAAIAACIDACVDGDEDFVSGGQPPPMYIRWFPLMTPREAAPTEGDMGLSSRPKESEQLRDNMFQQYFAPVIQLALSWWPNQNRDSVPKTPNLRSSIALEDTETLEHGGTDIIKSYFNSNMRQISAALIDSQRANELLSLTALDIEIRHSTDKAKTRAGVVVGWIQIDHQDSKTREPVVLAPTPVEHIQPTLQILIVRDNLRSKNRITSYEYVGIALQELDLTVEEGWIFDIWDFLTKILRRRRAKRRTVKGQRKADVLLTSENCFRASDLEYPITSPSLMTILDDEGDEKRTSGRTYVEQLILGLIKVNLSYIKGKKFSREFNEQGAKIIKNLDAAGFSNLALPQSRAIISRNGSKSDDSGAFLRWSQHTDDDDNFIDNEGALSFNLPGLIAAVFPSVSDAPIRLQGKAMEHLFEKPVNIISSIKTFYVTETLKQVYKIIGSLDFVGNPTILFSSFVSGVRDLVVAPTTAFLKSPTNVNQVGIGVAKGAISLFSHSASGIFGFTAKMSATAGQAAAILSLDNEYREWHRDRIVSKASNLNREWKKRGVQTVSEMVTKPVTDIVIGFTMGTTGFFISPYKGLRKGGGLGLLRGVAVGTVGIVTKPIVGFLDAFTHFSATAHDIARSVNVLERRFQPVLKLRLPYSFGPMKILSPFDTVTARSVKLLLAFPPKVSRSAQKRANIARYTEIHVASEVLLMEPSIETFLIVSTIRIALIKLKKENNGSLTPSLGWEVNLGKRTVVSSRVSDHGHNGVALTITKRKKDSRDVLLKSKKGKGPKESSTPHDASAIIDGTNSFRRDSSNGSLDAASNENDGSEAEVGIETDSNPFEKIQALSSVDIESHSQSGGENGYVSHGATSRSGEILEWFTVLAEYQHRQHLTKIHNAISCMVGEMNRVIDNQYRGDHESSGVTSFGIFQFGNEDTTRIPKKQRSNQELVASLENIPWFHSSVLNDISHKSRSQQRCVVHKMREEWTFSKELEASIGYGGPSWLVEARAIAMFQPGEMPFVPDVLDRGDPVVQDVIAQFTEGRISRRQAGNLLLSHADLSYSSHTSFQDDTMSSDRDSEAEILYSHAQHRPDKSSYTFEISGPQDNHRTIFRRHSSHASSSRTMTDLSIAALHASTGSLGQRPGNTLPIPASAPINHSVRSAHTAIATESLDHLDGHAPCLSRIDLQSSLPKSKSNITDDNPEFCDAKSVSSNAEQAVERHTNSKQSGLPESTHHNPSMSSPVSSPDPTRKRIVAPRFNSHVGTPPTQRDYPTSARTPSQAASRMDRMELVVEQLVQISAGQMLVNAGHQRAASDILSPDGSIHSYAGTTEAIRNDLAELRAQVQARNKEDDALRSEISALRQELAERRNKESGNDSNNMGLHIPGFDKLLQVQELFRPSPQNARSEAEDFEIVLPENDSRRFGSGFHREQEVGIDTFASSRASLVAESTHRSNEKPPPPLASFTDSPGKPKSSHSHTTWSSTEPSSATKKLRRHQHPKSSGQI